MEKNQLTIHITNPNAERLQKLIQATLTEGRMSKIVEQLAKKAEEGNVKALDYLLNIGGFFPTAPKTVIVNQYYADGRIVEQTTLDGR